MMLADRIAQYRTPFLVRADQTGAIVRLDNAAECAGAVTACALRYVLCDELTHLCTALVYSKGARTLCCADLLRMPAERLWIEWCQEPWERELACYGFRMREPLARGGRRGLLLHASRDGRRGTLRAFWTGERAEDVLASCIESYFDLDTEAGEEPEPPSGTAGSTRRVNDQAQGDADILGRCFRFRYERSWAEYYGSAGLDGAAQAALWRHSLGTVAPAIPIVLAFLLLLATRTGLPQRPQSFERLNRVRLKAGKPRLLEHIEVHAPLLEGRAALSAEAAGERRRAPRLHQVRGHLVRHGDRLFWRMPHLRGSARQGVVRKRTVTWTFAQAGAPTRL